MILNSIEKRDLARGSDAGVHRCRPEFHGVQDWSDPELQRPRLSVIAHLALRFCRGPAGSRDGDRLACRRSRPGRRTRFNRAFPGFPVCPGQSSCRGASIRFEAGPAGLAQWCRRLCRLGRDGIRTRRGDQPAQRCGAWPGRGRSADLAAGSQRRERFEHDRGQPGHNPGQGIQVGRPLRHEAGSGRPGRLAGPSLWPISAGTPRSSTG